ncbi:reductase with broad range of substrate specificity [Stachybotrys elegans]|uniref:Reductase with broad range of substrate specificity n=1 Tax=Stachybotrys elegans TaxID=80388 RepID=A0A8K0WJL8_9HYPO|nr:reductase with broad range of substrate specificity [Stachybotrys elegans]
MIDGKFSHNNTTPPAAEKVFDLFSLKGRTAIISGGGAGIGYAVAQALAEAGANVAIWYQRNKSAPEKAKAIETEYGVKCRAYQVNVTDAEAVETAILEQTEEFNGRLDVFVANAGIPWTEGPVIEGSLELYRKVMAINLDGVYFCARAAGRIWKRQQTEGTDMMGQKLENYSYGSFIATASMSGHIANIPLVQTAYNSSKAAVIHMCRSLGTEWCRYARANAVSPGYIDTEISTFASDETKGTWKHKIPMGREGSPHEVKGVYLFLASDASSYMTGADLVIDGGYTCI